MFLRILKPAPGDEYPFKYSGPLGRSDCSCSTVTFFFFGLGDEKKKKPCFGKLQRTFFRSACGGFFNRQRISYNSIPHQGDGNKSERERERVESAPGRSARTHDTGKRSGRYARLARTHRVIPPPPPLTSHMLHCIPADLFAKN